MQAGVDHQPRGAEQFGVQPHEVCRVIREGAHFLAYRLGIKAPTFAKRDIAGDRAELWPALLAHLDVALRVVAGDGLVTHQGIERGGVRRVADQVDISARGPLAIGAGGRGMGRAAGHFGKGRFAHHFDPELRQRAEILGQQRAGVRDEGVGGGEVFGAGGIVERLGRIEPGALGIERVAVLEPGLAGKGILLRLDPGDFGAADRVDLLGGVIGRGVELELAGVIVRAARQGQRADLAAGGGGQFAFGPRDHAVIAGLQRQHGGARLGQQGVSLGAGQLAGGDQRFRLGLHIGPQRGVRPGAERRAAGQLFAARDDRFDLEFWRADAGGVAGFAAVNRDVEHGGNAAHASDIGLQVRDISHGMGVDQEVRQLAVDRIEPGIERRAKAPVGEGLFGPVGFQCPDVKVNLRFGRQLCPVERGAHPRHAGLAPFDLRQCGSIADVVPAVGPVLQPQPGRQLRLGLHVFGKFRIEKRGQSSVFGGEVGGGGGGGGSWRCGLRMAGGDRHQQAGGKGRDTDGEFACHGGSRMLC